MRGRDAGQEPRKVWKELELRGDGGRLEESQDQNEVEQLFLLRVTTPRPLRVLALSASNCSRSVLPHLADDSFPPSCTGIFSPLKASAFTVLDSRDSYGPSATAWLHCPQNIIFCSCLIFSFPALDPESENLTDRASFLLGPVIGWWPVYGPEALRQVLLQFNNL